jgi:hypothetical protein
VVKINQVSVQAPIDSTDCAATPATITVLGLPIDVSKAVYGPRWFEGAVTCSVLQTGQVVKVFLTSDMTDTTTQDYTATEVDLLASWHRDRGCWGPAFDDLQVQVAAPLQIIDSSDVTVTALGLPINIAGARLFNDNLDPITASQLKVGQFAKMTLASNTTPLAATTLITHVDQIKVRAPVTATNCPSTITILGLAIDVSKATFGRPWNWHWRGGGRGCWDGGMRCEDLRIGQPVVVELTGDTTPTATEVEAGFWFDGVKVSAPIQTIDTTNTALTVLGLPVSLSGAKIRDDNWHTITFGQLSQGQFVNLDLISDTAPLTATAVVAHTGTNQLHIRVFDEKGKPVVGMVNAVVTIKNKKSAVTLQVAGGGTLLLTSVPAGQANIVVTRVYNGKTGKGNASTTVKADTNKLITVKLRAVK